MWGRSRADVVRLYVDRKQKRQGAADITIMGAQVCEAKLYASCEKERANVQRQQKLKELYSADDGKLEPVQKTELRRRLEYEERKMEENQKETALHASQFFQALNGEMREDAIITDNAIKKPVDRLVITRCEKPMDMCAQYK